MENAHVIVLFGATGDLARRKLLPGLLHLWQAGLLDDSRIVGTSLDDLDTETFVKHRARGLRRVRQEAGRRGAVGRRSRELLSYVPHDRRPDGAGRGRARRRGGASPTGGRDGRLPALPERAAQGRARRGPPARRGRPGRAVADHHGEAVRHRPGVGAQAQRPAARGVRRGPDLPDRPLPRQGGGAEHPGLPVRQRPVRADLEPQLHRPRADRRPRDARPRGRARSSTSPPAPTATWSSPT